MQTREEILKKKNQEQKNLTREALKDDFNLVLSVLRSLKESNKQNPDYVPKKLMNALNVINKNILRAEENQKSFKKLFLGVVAFQSILIIIFLFLFL